MTGVFILLGFALITFVVGACLMITCYWRTKSKQRNEEKGFYECNSHESQIGMYPGGGIGPYFGVTNPRY
ncbi:unnamed protein product [Dracunculus medinensis]|uniref:Uncharacterized protein n=1 Tax=Dracunculus medinensis TaxID=318479 RepID=A0A0N4UL29_DRAME|nr:unnamed protein product [Dracunculus medinensis]